MWVTNFGGKVAGGSGGELQGLACPPPMHPLSNAARIRGSGKAAPIDLRPNCTHPNRVADRERLRSSWTTTFIVPAPAEGPPPCTKSRKSESIHDAITRHVHSPAKTMRAVISRPLLLDTLYCGPASGTGSLTMATPFSNVPKFALLSPRQRAR
ncbi:unnamed protein product, partial [Iphiclides podalirius]